MAKYHKKLIEVALPLEAINVAGQREQSIRNGHPSAYPWWSRKPLSVARAVLFASLVDDPSAHPDDFSDEDSQEDERRRLFGIIEELIKWENTQNSSVITEAQTEIRRNNHALPIMVDPFAGGGSIPLSAQLLGLDVEASDLNPVAVLINKALLELPPKFKGVIPIGPTKDQTFTTDWPGASGLAEDVNRYSRWLNQQARELIGHNYPTVEIPSSGGGGESHSHCLDLGQYSRLHESSLRCHHAFAYHIRPVTAEKPAGMARTALDRFNWYGQVQNPTWPRMPLRRNSHQKQRDMLDMRFGSSAQRSEGYRPGEGPRISTPMHGGRRRS